MEAMKEVLQAVQPWGPHILGSGRGLCAWEGCSVHETRARWVGYGLAEMRSTRNCMSGQSIPGKPNKAKQQATILQSSP